MNFFHSGQRKILDASVNSSSVAVRLLDSQSMVWGIKSQPCTQRPMTRHLSTFATLHPGIDGYLAIAGVIIIAGPSGRQNKMDEVSQIIIIIIIITDVAFSGLKSSRHL